MSSIDDRIVRLEVQDSEFAKRLEQDESLLKKFNSTLNSVGDTKISDNLQKIADRFSNLGIVGVRALQNITDKAISAGSQLVKSLSVDNISSGWQKLQSQTKAVGTLSIQGYDMEEVNEVIKQLMWYSDETSYNFEDMLTSMTKFTAQGYELKEAMETLEGIANWSAVAGQNAAAGSAAMTALSKAVGRGYLQQQDWSSLQTLMMDNKQVRQMILDTAVQLGTLKKTGEGTYRSLSKQIMSNIGASEFTIDQFATYLTTGKWLTSDVLVATMKKYAEAVKPVYDYVEQNGVSAADAIKALNGQLSEEALNFFAAAQEARSLSDALESVRVGSASTWQKTFNIIFGDYERQKEIWTDLSGYLYELFVESGNARNALLEQWAAKGGADAIIQGFYNIMEALIALRDTFRTAWQSIFPPTTVESLLNFSNKFKNFTENLILSEEASTKLGRALQGVFSVFRLGKDILQALLRPIGELLGTSGNLGDTILTIAQTVGDAVTNFVHWVEVSGILDKAVNVVIGTVKVLWSVVKVVGAAILYAIAGIIVGVSKLISLLRNFGSSFVDAFKNAADGVKSFLGGLKKVKKDTSDVVEVQRSYAGAMQETTEEGEEATKNVGGMTEALKNFGSSLSNLYKNNIKPIFDKISEFIGLKSIFSGGLIPGLYKLLSMFIAFKTLLGIGNLISSVANGIASVIKIVGVGVNALSALVNNLQAKAWLTYAAAIAVTVASLYALSKIPAEDITRVLKTFSSLILMITASIGKMSLIPTIALALLSKVNLWPVILAFGGLVAAIFGLSIASNVISRFGEEVTSIFSDQNVKRIVGNIQLVAGIFNVLSKGLEHLFIGVAFLKIGSAFKTLAKNIKSAITLLSPSFTVNVFQKDTSWAGKILKFATSIALVAGSIVAIAKLVDKDEFWKGVGTVTAIAAGLTVMSWAIAGISKIAKLLKATKDESTVSMYDYAKPIVNLAKAIAMVAATIVALGYINSKNADIIETGSHLVMWISIAVGIGAWFVSKIKTIDHTASVLKSLAGAFVGMGLATIMVAAALKMVAKYQPGQLLEGGVALAGIVAELGIIIYGISKAIGTIKGAGGRIVLAAIAFNAMALGLMAIAVAINSVVSDDWKKTLAAAGGLAAVVIAIAGAVKILQSSITTVKLDKARKSISRFIETVAYIGVVLGSAAGAIALLKWFVKDVVPLFESVKPDAFDNITKALAQLGVASALIVGVGVGLTKLSKDLKTLGKTILGIGAIVVVIAGITASLWVLTDALTALQNIKWPTLAKAGVILLGLVAAVKQVITMGLGLGLIATAAPEIAGIVIAAIIAIIAVGATLIIGIKELVNIVDFLGESVAKNAPGIAQGIKDIADAILYCVYAIGSIPRTLGAGFIGLGTGDNANYKNAINNITALVAAAEQGGKDVVEVEKSYAANSQQIVKEGYDNVQETVTEGGEDIESSVDETGKNVEKKTLSWWDKLKSGAALATAQIPIIGDWASKKILSTIDTTSEESSQRAEQGGQQTMKSLAEGLLNGTVSVSDLVGQIPDLLNGWLFPEGTNWAAYNYGKDSATDLLNGFMDNAGTITYEKKLLSPSRKSQFGMVSQENPDPVNVVWVPKWTPPENKSILDQLNDMFDTEKLTSAVGDFGSLTDVLGDTVKESTKELQDWELSLEELVKKYSTLTTSWVNGQRVVNWAYNGPMGGVIDEYHEWVYEGPMGGEYDDITDQYVTDINGNVVALANWTAEWQELYMGHAEYMDDQIASINENTAALTTSISDQNSLISGYNEDILSSLSGLDTKLSGLNTGISSLGSSLSNMGVYLDGDVLAGGLTDKIEKNINLNNIYRQMGVIR